MNYRIRETDDYEERWLWKWMIMARDLLKSNRNRDSFIDSLHCFNSLKFRVGIAKLDPSIMHDISFCGD